MSLISRFKGDDGRRRLLDELKRQKLVEGCQELALAISERAELVEFSKATALITQAESDNDVFLVLAGTCDVLVNNRPVAVRGPGDHVGEMAAVQPAQARSATVVARDDVVAAKLSDADFCELADRYPQMYRAVARELARRLMQRNSLVGIFRDRIRVFIISSVESLGIARSIQDAFEHDDFHVEIWTDGVFKVASYTIEALEAEVDQADFAIAIAHPDDVTESRSQSWPAPRDNVIFELGLFMGRLGRHRAILMEPRDDKVKLPSDLAGITAIAYRYTAGRDAAAQMGPACNRLRAHIKELGPNNG